MGGSLNLIAPKWRAEVEVENQAISRHQQIVVCLLRLDGHRGHLSALSRNRVRSFLGKCHHASYARRFQAVYTPVGQAAYDQTPDAAGAMPAPMAIQAFTLGQEHG